MNNDYGPNGTPPVPKFRGPADLGINPHPRIRDMLSADVDKAVRHLWMVRGLKTPAAVQAMGELAGFFRRKPRKACPVRAGALREYWLHGWSIGQQRRLDARPEKPPGRPGPNGGRRIRFAA